MNFSGLFVQILRPAFRLTHNDTLQEGPCNSSLASHRLEHTPAHAPRLEYLFSLPSEPFLWLTTTFGPRFLYFFALFLATVALQHRNGRKHC